MKHNGPIVVQANSLTAIDCQVCGYVHLDPLPTQAELDQLYEAEYYQTHNAGWFEKERREQWYWWAVYNQRLRYAKSFFALKPILIPRQQPMKIFDMGAGCGWFMKTAQSLPAAVDGQDASEKACQFAIEVLRVYPICTSQSVLAHRQSVYDFVHASLVFEHLLNPLDMLQDAYSALRPGGILCIIVPNEFNPYQCQLENYTPLHQHHLNYFTPQSLKALCKKAGFEIVRHTSTFPIEWFALHGLNYIKHPRLGKVAHWLRMIIEWTALTTYPDRWEAQRDRWAARGVGREIELWVRKV